jgi:Cof subfamily protein (haloacid dehalogenase superfamily)
MGGNIVNYQLVLSDIDGTILTDDFQLLPSTEKTISDLVKAGVLFATVSARNMAYTKVAISNIREICCANAYLNGAYIISSDGDVLVDNPIGNEDASLLIKHCINMGASFCYFSKNDVMAKIRHQELKEAFTEYYGPYSEISTINKTHLKPYFIAVYYENIRPFVDFANKHLKNIESGAIVRFQIQELWIEESQFQYKGINKGTALAIIAKYLGIDVSKTIAIGDGLWNDGPMIDIAGCGVAMKNAHKEIISKAQYVTEKDNNEDGVGDFLRKMFGL